MSRERLDQLRDVLNDAVEHDILSGDSLQSLMGFFRKQTERVQDLEEFKASAERLYKNYHLSAKRSIEEKEQLRNENKRYREALEKVVKSANAGKVLPHIDSHTAKIARQALEGKA